MRPVLPSRITNPFAQPGSYASRADRHGRAGHHTGIDFGALWPTPIDGSLVRSVTPGEVVISGFNATMGNWVGVYHHETDVLVTYWHLSSRYVFVGDWVQVFAPVGRVGNTGNSTAPHLHVQMNKGREFDYHGHINPWPTFRLFGQREAKRIHRREPVHPNA